jgi:hypothetical protein
MNTLLLSIALVSNISWWENTKGMSVALVVKPGVSVTALSKIDALRYKQKIVSYPSYGYMYWQKGSKITWTRTSAENDDWTWALETLRDYMEELGWVHIAYGSWQESTTEPPDLGPYVTQKVISHWERENPDTGEAEWVTLVSARGLSETWAQFMERHANGENGLRQEGYRQVPV